MNTATATQLKKNPFEDEKLNFIFISDKRNVKVWVSKNTSTTTKLVASEDQANLEINELDLLNVYVKPTPTSQFKIKAKVNSITKGELKVFPDELDFDNL
jgi:hypothetical protein